MQLYFSEKLVVTRNKKMDEPTTPPELLLTSLDANVQACVLRYLTPADLTNARTPTPTQLNSSHHTSELNYAGGGTGGADVPGAGARGGGRCRVVHPLPPPLRARLLGRSRRSPPLPRTPTFSRSACCVL